MVALALGMVACGDFASWWIRREPGAKPIRIKEEGCAFIIDVFCRDDRKSFVVDYF